MLVHHPLVLVLQYAHSYSVRSLESATNLSIAVSISTSHHKAYLLFLPQQREIRFGRAQQPAVAAHESQSQLTKLKRSSYKNWFHVKEERKNENRGEVKEARTSTFLFLKTMYEGCMEKTYSER